jgi:hypothetical protein
MAAYTLDAAKKPLPGGPHFGAVLLPALLAAGKKVVTQSVFNFKFLLSLPNVFYIASGSVVLVVW